MSMNMEKDTCETTANGLDGDMSAERAQNARGTALRLFKKLMAQRGKLLIILFSIIIGSAFNILSPKGIGIAVNEIFTGVQNAIAKGETFQVNLETMGAVLLGLLGLYLLTSLFSYIQQNTMASVSPDADADAPKGNQRETEPPASALFRPAQKGRGAQPRHQRPGKGGGYPAGKPLPADNRLLWHFGRICDDVAHQPFAYADCRGRDLCQPDRGGSGVQPDASLFRRQSGSTWTLEQQH